MNNNPWYIGKVVNIDDPDKRRRIQVRGPQVSDETVMPTEKLDWLQPLQLHPDDFSLPNVDESVLVLKFGKLKFWVELPNKQAWEELGDDYATAWIFNHRDALKAAFKESTGFDFTFVGEIKVHTDSTETSITKDSFEFTFDKVALKTDGSSVTATIKDAEISTDGTLITIKNNNQNLKSILDALIQAIMTHTHSTAVGPSGTIIDVPTVQKVQTDLAKLLQ